jgi:hypothetical protein
VPLLHVVLSRSCFSVLLLQYGLLQHVPPWIMSMRFSSNGAKVDNPRNDSSAGFGLVRCGIR